MANIKFSAFTQKVALGDVDFLVGYTGADNVRVAPSVFSGLYLPLAGGTMTGNVVFNDNVEINLGTGGSSDSKIYSDGTDINFRNLINDGDISFRATNTTNGMKEYFALDGGVELTRFYQGVNFNDNVKLTFGDVATPGDLEIYHDSSNSYIVDTGTGDLRLLSSGTAIMSASGAEYIAYFAGTGAQNASLYAGNVKKFETTTDGVTVTGALSITGDGSNATTLTESGGGDFDIVTVDDLRLTSGGNDIVLKGASSAEFGRLSNDSQNTIIRNLTSDKDIIFKGNDGGSTITALTLDMSEAGNATFAGNVILGDDQQIQLGNLSGGDMKLYHVPSIASYVLNKTDDLRIVNQANDKDIIFETDDGSGSTATYFYLDGSATNGTSVLGATKFPDKSKIYIGTGADLEIFHDGTNTYLENYTGDFIFTQAANDKDIQFKCDDGSGGSTLYYYLDGSRVINRFPKNVYLEDNVKLLFGDVNTPDLEIYHDTGNSYIVDTGTGSLKVGAANWHLMDSALAAYMMTATPGAECNLYFNGSGRFITTSDGVKVTGQYNVAALNTAPASASAAGTLGEIRYTADYIYVCTATNTWKRTALSTW